MSIFDVQTDFELCDLVFSELSGDRIDVDACNELERVVRLVWDSSGLIGNGGFHRLFEGDYPGDPGFVYTAAAYKRIGAQHAYDAFQAAFRLFPGGILPSKSDERLRILESLPKESLEEIVGHYYDAEKETESCLARFIREHRSGYQHLLELKRTEQRAAPTDGPVTALRKSRVTQGPSSVT